MNAVRRVWRRVDAERLVMFLLWLTVIVLLWLDQPVDAALVTMLWMAVALSLIALKMPRPAKPLQMKMEMVDFSGEPVSGEVTVTQHYRTGAQR